MRRLYFATVAMALGACAFLQCSDDDDPVAPKPDASTDVSVQPPPPPPDSSVVVTNVDVTAHISGDARWTADHTYTLKGKIYVLSGTLTIEPGVKILGDDPTAMLVVTPDAKINAVGTAANPIVFTSAKPPGQRAANDWNGLQVGGKAPINNPPGDAGYPTQDFFVFDGGAVAPFGGTDSAHDCGKLKYVRFEFAFKGLFLGGCGTQTEVDFIETHRTVNDGVEIHGGTVNLKHVVASQWGDSALNWKAGWTGRLQFAAFIASGGEFHVKGDNGPILDASAAPQSNPTLYNTTMVGTGGVPGAATPPQQGILLRQGTGGKIFNAIVMKVADRPLDILGSGTVANAQSGSVDVRNSVFWDNSRQGATFPSEPDDEFAEEPFLFDGGRSNRAVDPALTDPQNLLTPSFKPQAGAPVLTGAATPPGDGFFDPAATFVGAIGATDWTTGWVAYPQN
jgi:hypothetical protein